MTPDVTLGKSLAEIEKLEVFEGNVKSSLADFFTVRGDPTDGVHEWAGGRVRRVCIRYAQKCRRARLSLKAMPGGISAAR